MAFLLYACLYWALMLSPEDVQCDLLERKYIYIASKNNRDSRTISFLVQVLRKVCPDSKAAAMSV